ncbi:micronuclear linker histone polyprotein-like [Haliotis asinina]|uniref:micronuclear linker histone polyprotein-like n=1 Tax=Haliotis asinina TaxID=109174 RepID=UPI003531CB94
MEHTARGYYNSMGSNQTSVEKTNITNEAEARGKKAVKDEVNQRTGQTNRGSQAAGKENTPRGQTRKAGTSNNVKTTDTENQKTGKETSNGTTAQQGGKGTAKGTAAQATRKGGAAKIKGQSGMGPAGTSQKQVEGTEANQKVQLGDEEAHGQKGNYINKKTQPAGQRGIATNGQSGKSGSKTPRNAQGKSNNSKSGNKYETQVNETLDELTYGHDRKQQQSPNRKSGPKAGRSTSPSFDRYNRDARDKIGRLPDISENNYVSSRDKAEKNDKNRSHSPNSWNQNTRQTLNDDRRDDSPRRGSNAGLGNDYSPDRQGDIRNNDGQDDYRKDDEQNDYRRARSQSNESLTFDQYKDKVENGRREMLARSSERMNKYDDGDDDEDDTNDAKSLQTSRVQREKIETYLRSSRVPETKVRGLALRLSQVYSEETDKTPSVFEGQKTERILRKIIHNGLDPIVNGSKGKTNLDRFENDPEGLAQKVSEMVHQVEMDLEDCKVGLNITAENEDEEEEQRGRRTSRDPSPYKKGKDKNGNQTSRGKNGNDSKTNREGQKTKKGSGRDSHQKPGQPVAVLIQDGIRELQTQYDILQDKYEHLLNERNMLQSDDNENKEMVGTFFQENRKLEQDLKKVEQESGYLNKTLGKVKSEEQKLRTTLKTVDEERNMLRSENKEAVGALKALTRELNKLQDENAQLMSENTAMRSNVRRLQEPDKKMVSQIQQLTQEAKELKTQTRRLEGEKGALRASLQRLEATLDTVQTEKKQLMHHRDTVVREKKKLEAMSKKFFNSGSLFD